MLSLSALYQFLLMEKNMLFLFQDSLVPVYFRAVAVEKTPLDSSQKGVILLIFSDQNGL
jgi:hypothetical protein